MTDEEYNPSKDIVKIHLELTLNLAYAESNYLIVATMADGQMRYSKCAPVGWILSLADGKGKKVFFPGDDEFDKLINIFEND